MKGKCIELLKQGYSVTEILDKLQITEHSWRKLGMTKLPKYKNIFEEINEVSAYWLGFLWADGSLTGKSLELELNISDLEHLKLFVQSVSLIKSPKIYIRNRNNSDTCRINFSDTSIANSLNELGFNKKGIRCAPNINDEYMVHFLKGYFDGDGSFIERIHNGNIEFRADLCGPINFINYILKYLPNPTYSEIINNKKWQSKRIYWNGESSAKTIISYFNNSVIKLQRKEPLLLH